MIRRSNIPGGIQITAKPFSIPNENATCAIIGEVTTVAREKHYRFRADNVRWMKLSDAAIFMTAFRAVVDETQKHAETRVQKTLAEIQEAQASAAKAKAKRKKANVKAKRRA